MSLNDFYINSIQAKKKGNMGIYNKTLNDLFGKQLSWSEVKELDRDKQIKLMVYLNNNIKVDKSPYDIKKLARAIQNSRSGAGGCALTEFKCAFCGEVETWSNTVVPKICSKCAIKMASNIVMSELDLLK